MEHQQQYIGSLIHEGFYDQLVIIGYPYDQGARSCKAIVGQDYGPDSFRRFVNDIGSIENPEFAIDISKGLSKISDYGNIQVPGWKPGHPLNEVQDKLSTKVGLCLQRNKLSFIVGGTRDVFCPVADAIFKQQKKCLFIIIRNKLDISNDDGDINQNNSLRKFLNNEHLSNGNNKAIIIGLDQPKQEDIETLLTYQNYVSLVTLHDINMHQIQDGQLMKTKLGQIINNILQEAKDYTDIDQISISISMEAIDGVTGVSTKCIKGITTEEAIEVCLAAGYKSDKVVSIDISDYNPFIEDWSTGRLLATMFYYLCMGLSAHNQDLSLIK